MIGLIALSLASTLIVSFLIGFGFYFIDENLSYAVFWITFALILLVMEPINRVLANKTLKREADLLTKHTKYASTVGKQLVTLECEYCNEPNAIKIDINSINSFVCTKCNNRNNVLLQFNTSRVTNPVDIISTDTQSEIIDEFGDDDET